MITTTKTRQNDITSTASPLWEVRVFNDDIEVDKYIVATDSEDEEAIALNLYKIAIGEIPAIPNLANSIPDPLLPTVSIQEQQTLIEALTARLTALEAK